MLIIPGVSERHTRGTKQGLTFTIVTSYQSKTSATRIRCRNSRDRRDIVALKDDVCALSNSSYVPDDRHG